MGLELDGKISMIGRLIRRYKVNFCFLQETKLKVVFGDLVRRFWGDNFDFRYAATVGSSSGIIAILDKEYFQMSKEYCVNQYVMVEGK